MRFAAAVLARVSQESDLVERRLLHSARCWPGQACLAGYRVQRSLLLPASLSAAMVLAVAALPVHWWQAIVAAALAAMLVGLAQVALLEEGALGRDVARVARRRRRIRRPWSGARGHRRRRGDVRRVSRRSCGGDGCAGGPDGVGAACSAATWPVAHRRWTCDRGPAHVVLDCRGDVLGRSQPIRLGRGRDERRRCGCGGRRAAVRGSGVKCAGWP